MVYQGSFQNQNKALNKFRGSGLTRVKDHCTLESIFKIYTKSSKVFKYSLI